MAYDPTDYEEIDALQGALPDIGTPVATVSATKLNKGEAGIQAAQDTADDALDAASAAAVIASAAADAADAATLAVAVVKEAPLNVRYEEYGAVGDGSTNDTAAFTAALMAVNGGKMYVPRGIYSVADAEVLDEGVTIIGDGLGTPGDGQGTIIKARAGADYALKALGKRYLSLRDLVIDGNERDSAGFLYEATVSATGQTLEMTHVRFFRCTKGWHIGPGPGAISQTDKNTLTNTDFFECDYGFYNEAINSQNTILNNCDFGTTYITSIHLAAGCVTMNGGQFQGYGAANTKGIAIDGLNVGWVNLKDVIFEGPEWDVHGGPGFWPNYGMRAEGVTFQGPTANVLIDREAARFSARHCAFNADFDPATVGGGILSWNQGGGILSLEFSDYAFPFITGAVLPIVIGGGSPYGIVASASTITVPLGANVVRVTGTTNITNITANNMYQGQVVTFVFAGALTMVDGGNLRLQGDFPTAADDAITLSCDGAAWYEC